MFCSSLNANSIMGWSKVGAIRGCASDDFGLTKVLYVWFFSDSDVAQNFVTMLAKRGRRKEIDIPVGIDVYWPPRMPHTAIGGMHRRIKYIAVPNLRIVLDILQFVFGSKRHAFSFKTNDPSRAISLTQRSPRVPSPDGRTVEPGRCAVDTG